MSNLVFPDLAGVKVDLEREPIYRTQIKEAFSGKEQRRAAWSAPRYRYRMNFEFLRSAATLLELQKLVGFFARHAGAWDSFLFTDPEDNAAGTTGYGGFPGQVFGIGDGVITAFQLQRSLAAVIPPIPQSFTATPSASGGTLATGTYFYAVAAIMADGTESVAATASAAVTGPTGSVVLACAAVTGAALYRWFRATGGAGWNGATYWTTANPTYTDTGTTGTSGLPHPYSFAFYPVIGDGYEPVWDPAGPPLPGAAPVIMVSGVVKSMPADYSISSTGLVTFTAAPANTSVLTWTGSFYRRVRFDSDSMTAKRLVQTIWEAGSVDLRSVIP